MHHCLTIPEILNQIFEQLVDVSQLSPAPADPTVAVNWRALARLARCCRTFQDPALDRLYFKIDWFGNFLRCLPSDLWERHGTGDDKKIVGSPER
ncbi:hypothetical protein HYDPIDRAFT_34763 [Hydnomerulius pinastri MD-312]|uniref:Unplaced genomic scaffold scaffold_263, whole genome shotgun sequence n=1 Tax=Hydnomerulius pinastri MD-312 TaxID=994086 RepID=A0A0C9W5G8_9AGAM|nr:hypothetical protein HYDPIDRAFT_34763 [Hydnomerulius pinastri MD-312]